MDDAGLPSAFLAGLGAADQGDARERLQQELEWFAHPRVRVASARCEPVDTLVEFLATTQLALPAEPHRAFRAAVAEADSAARSATSPRDSVVALVEELFGAAPDGLADQLARLIAHCARTERALDSRTVRRLYAEASNLCDVWVLALNEGLVSFADPVGTADEIQATEGAVLASFDPADPAAVGRCRIELVNHVSQLSELVALDRWGLLPVRDWPAPDAPSLGWPAFLAQAQYRLRQIAGVGPQARVKRGSGGREPRGGGRHGEALHLLAAFDAVGGGDGLLGLTAEQHEEGRQRIQRSRFDALPLAAGLQAADLAWSLRRTPELMTVHGLGPADAAERTAALLPALLGGLRPGGSAVGPDRLPLNAWELRELFPELRRLLAVHREQLAHGDLSAYWESEDASLLPVLAADAYLRSRGRSARAAAEATGELAAFTVLFADDAATDAALALFGEEPRGREADPPWWDDLSRRGWLRGATAELMRQAGRAGT